MNVLPEDQVLLADSKAAEQKGHPKGLYVLFATEFWERFSYYGMRAIFVLFMTNKLLFDKAYASNIYGSYTGLVYLTPLIGGYVADRYWGNRRSIFVGGLLMALGQFILFFCASATDKGASGFTTTLLWTGLAFLIFGNGFFKPNISTMVGQLYPETEAGAGRKDAAYTIFYMGINAGAFFAPLICGYLGENVDFKWGFLAAGVGMIISLIIFYFTKDKYVVSHDGRPLGVTANKSRDAGTATPGDIAAAPGKTGFSSGQILMLVGAIVAAFLIIWKLLGVDFWGSAIYAMTAVGPFAILTDRSLTKTEKDRLWVIVIIMIFVIFFWMCFEQAGASLTFFADEQTDRHLGNWEMPASYFQSFNAGFIVLLAPIFAALWSNLGKRGINPPAPMKQAIGLGLLALGFLYISLGTPADPLVKVSIWWLTGLYFLHTVGELFLSPIGLSMVNKLTPGRFTSLMMGIWFLAIATGNKLAGTMSSLYPDPKATGPRPVFLGITIDNLHTYFMIFVAFAGVAAVILFLLSFKLRKMMHGVK
ncbi:peptide MFS transporter [Flaviaesturariibacter aridisoli]|uniref:MFS transporter n=1 Tax=Flaviaesturariibacter aridisoli TaxID=2545761 RepID=A0A4R4DVE2_9BACT|nr:peptide MFS transporter [Flaviaesturariibacter aridisoli]TCZ67203.1 MFS transporter [Flaviaesturariibacter aridisoli]